MKEFDYFQDMLDGIPEKDGFKILSFKKNDDKQILLNKHAQIARGKKYPEWYYGSVTVYNVDTCQVSDKTVYQNENRRLYFKTKNQPSILRKGKRPSKVVIQDLKQMIMKWKELSA